MEDHFSHLPFTWYEIIPWTPADSLWFWESCFLCPLATKEQILQITNVTSCSPCILHASLPSVVCLMLPGLRSHQITVAVGIVVPQNGTSIQGRALASPVLALYSWLHSFFAPFSDVKGRNRNALNKSQGLENRKQNISEKQKSAWEELSVWETSSWVTESWHSFYLFIKFVTVEISLRSCRPITVSFIILLRHTLRHSWRLNPIVLCNKPIIDYAMEL